MDAVKEFPDVVQVFGFPRRMRHHLPEEGIPYRSLVLISSCGPTEWLIHAFFLKSNSAGFSIENEPLPLMNLKSIPGARLFY
jgi:hypothetical protein